MWPKSPFLRQNASRNLRITTANFRKTVFPATPLGDRKLNKRSQEKVIAIIDKIREKVRNGDFEFTIPHFFEEMADDDLIFSDIEIAIARGRVRRRFTRDPRGVRYEVVGTALDGREIAVVCRIKVQENFCS